MVLGVVLYIADYAERSDSKGWLPANGSVQGKEAAAIVLVTCGTIAASLFSVSFYNVAALRKAHKKVTFTPLYFDLLQDANWTPAHTKICGVMLLAITIDLMKPATIGLLMPGLLAEYKLTKTQGAVLPTVAIASTTAGSIIWGFMADRFGRRFAIVLSTVLFVSTSICGTMPSFAMNVFMCVVMGVSVGGLIPIAVSLLSEVLPSRHRTKGLISVLAAGSACGYLAASGFSYLLQTYFSWRTLWFVGLPTGLIMLPLCLAMPESFRFLVVAGRDEDACRSMELYFGIKCTPEKLREYYQEVQETQPDTAGQTGTRGHGHGHGHGHGQGQGHVDGGVELTHSSPNPAPTAPAGTSLAPHPTQEFDREYWYRSVPLTCSMSFLALSWGLCNYGFVTYIPIMLTSGTGTIKLQLANSLIFYSSCASVAFVPLYIYLYGFLSSRWALASMAWWELVMFISFAGAYQTILTNPVSFCVWYTFFLGSHNAVLAMITVYSAENFTTKMRGRGTGLISAASRVAGVFAPYSITSILTFGAPWQMSVAVGVPLCVGAAFFSVYSQETAQYDSDQAASVFSPVGPLYEEQEAFLDPRPRTTPRGSIVVEYEVESGGGGVVHATGREV